ncbi:helicase C-terminal domain-containing protein [Fructilactobacillus vespulae]|uniref:helicase C-terminal domain-containing protein n=1 Tax=Fructilactobacillus vespulae TaxID=1249630 RepID=UPI0039B65C7C
MNQNSIFAVVDMETTGTNIKHGDHIIQFSVDFIEDNQIIDSYSTYVNDGIDISAEITELTGIDNETIQDAPTFDQIAPLIYQKLNQTVFVAHNVNFDFPFLNRSLERVGYPELEIEAIDTVTLTQIFFPTLDSYRLSDLSSYFKIEHEHPHSSESDAAATAILLLKIITKINNLPASVLESILDLNVSLPKDTSTFINLIYSLNKQGEVTLPNDLVNVEGLILKKPAIKKKENELKVTKFPKNKRQKELLFGDHFNWRESQSKMMNIIYNNYSDKKKKPTNLLIEAPTGSGKSLGYLVPMAYLAKDAAPVVISTATISLQNQIKKNVQTQLNNYFGFSLESVILKGKQHYLDLNRFLLNLIIDDGNKQSQFIKAQILVWLTETETGDLDELDLPNNAVIKNQINYQAEIVTNDVELGEYDFLERKRKALKTADIIITNHNYLFENAAKITNQIDEIPYLVVDEAHRLPDMAFASQQKRLYLGTIKQNIGRVKNDIFQTHADNINDVFADDKQLLSLIGNVVSDLDELGNSHEYILTEFRKTFMKRLPRKRSEVEMKSKLVNQFLDKFDLILKKQFKVGKQLQKLLKQINQIIAERNERWTPSDYELFLRFNEHLLNIINYSNSLETEVADLKNTDSDVFLLSYTNDMDPNNTAITTAKFDTKNNLIKNVYRYFQPAIYTGAVLFTSKKSQYIYDQLSLKRSNTRMKRLQSTYDFANNLNLMISKQTPTPMVYEDDKYVEYLANSIREIYNSSAVPTLVLFNSLKLIEKVYEKITNFDNHPFVLASGISGSQDKIIKRFNEAESAIILGASGFWEGVDFEPDKLKSVIIPRIPFAAPNNPLVKARSSFLREMNKNPFTSYSVPNAIMTLKQGMGRLIRSENDFGTITILDNRIITKKYGDQIVRSFAVGIEPQIGSISELTAVNKQFFADKNNTNDSELNC